MPRTLGELISEKVQSDPELDVLTFVDIDATGDFHAEVRTYRQLFDNARRIACRLRQDGLRPGDRVALLLHNHPEFVEAMIAASITATVFVPLDPRAPAQALHQRLQAASCKAAIVADYALSSFTQAQSRLEGLNAVYVIETGVQHALPCGAVKLADVMSGPAPSIEPVPTDENSVMQLLFTSGTTGEPKAIASPQRRFINSGVAAATMFGFAANDRPYTGLSLVHANAQMVTLGAILYMGLRGVISRRFTKTRLWDITRRYGCTVFNLLGGMAVALYAEPERSDDADNPVRLVISAGMSVTLWERFRRRFGVDILEFYGAAEGGLTINRPGDGPIGSVGRPPPGYQVAILDQQGQRRPAGVAGEICFRLQDGAVPLVKYFNDPVASAKKTAGDWLHMGDVGHLDENGWLFFHYRMGEGIRRNGEFLEVSVVERTLAESAAVSDVFVYGVAAASGAPGEKDMVAAIVPSDPAGFDPQALFAYCRRTLPGNLIPSYVHVVAEIPKTASEKPQERVLAARFAAGDARIFTEANAAAVWQTG